MNGGQIFTPYWTDREVPIKPGFGGGSNWPPSSYDPATGFLYVCAQDRIGVFRADALTEERPPAGEFLSYEERTGGTVDYVLVMATEPLAALDHEEADWIAAQLQHGYELIYISQGHGFARLYRRTPNDSEQARKLARSGAAKNPDPHP